MPHFPIYQAFSATATDDNPFNLVTLDIWFREVDVFVYTHDAYIGTLTDQNINIAANDVYTIRGPLNIRELYFKNYAAGNNTVVVIAGVAMSDMEKRAMGLG